MNESNAPVRAAETRYALRFHGEGTDLAVIVLKNVLLALVTVGIYSFWGKVNLRRFLWQNTEVHGDRLIYHGTGKELLVGWLKVIGVVAVFQGVNFVLMRVAPAVATMVTLGGGLCVFWLLGYAVFASQRYLYSRTTWRGIRFGMEPRAADFAWTFVRGYLATVFTLGFYAPVWQNRLYRIRTNNSRIGSLQMRFTGSDRDAFFLFLRSLPIIVLTLGLYTPWYATALRRWRAEHTWIGGDSIGAARGELTMTGGEYFRLMLVNFFCVILTAGLASPWVIAHNMVFMMKRFSFVGAIDFASIQQRASSGSAAGEGMADVLDVGFGV
jgi:uncharacterized membrane protein YjgN (DUF898 family)